VLKQWGKDTPVNEITKGMVKNYILNRAETKGNDAANYDLRILKALFNHGIEEGLCVTANPVKNVKELPTVKKKKYIPPFEDIEKAVSVDCDPDHSDYVLTVRETLGRGIEVNRLQWEEDIDLENRLITLRSRKKRGGSLTSRTLPMSDKLFEVLSKRYEKRDPTIPWVFWRRYYSRKLKQWVVGPYHEPRFMAELCEKAGVKYFRFHPLRHFGASLMALNGAPLTGIQYYLGHEYASTTAIYLHNLIGGDGERKAMEIYENAVKKLISEKVTQKVTQKIEGIQVSTPESPASS
jgi:integrase